MTESRAERIERTCGECKAGDRCRSFHSPYGKCEGNPLAAGDAGDGFDYLQKNAAPYEYAALFRKRK